MYKYIYIYKNKYIYNNVHRQQGQGHQPPDPPCSHGQDPNRRPGFRWLEAAAGGPEKVDEAAQESEAGVPPEGTQAAR